MVVDHAGQYDFEKALLEKTQCDIYTFDWYVTLSVLFRMDCDLIPYSIDHIHAVHTMGEV